jgi:hypothetical protein
MKVKIEIDLSPKELRSAFGLPDLEPLQREMMELIRDRVVATVDSLEPRKLLRLLLPESLPSFQDLQKFLWQSVAGEEKPDRDDDERGR